MAQGSAGLNILSNSIAFDDSGLDAFSRLRVSTPTYLFDSQFTYDLQPLLFEQVTAQTGASISHDSTNRQALLTFSYTPTGGKAYMQSYNWIRYQPGRSQLYFITYNFIETKTNTLKFVGVGDGNNGVQCELNGSTLQFTIYSDTGAGDETVPQSSWNIDKLNGTGSSGKTIDVTKTQILIIDYQALYVGRVRVGFDIGGVVIWCHEFLHSNLLSVPYIQNASLPIRCGMTCTGTVSTTMNFICSSAISEGGQYPHYGFQFVQESSVTAGSNTRTHLLSIRPKTTFNSIANRTEIIPEDVDILVTGNTPIKWELCIGQAISGTTTFNDVNTSYSGVEYNTAGTISGTPAIVIESGYIAATATSKSSISHLIKSRFPITLDMTGAARINGTLSLVVTGLGATSACRGLISWSELR